MRAWRREGDIATVLDFPSSSSATELHSGAIIVELLSGFCAQFSHRLGRSALSQFGTPSKHSIRSARELCVHHLVAMPDAQRSEEMS
jgi:hypothetical protein